MVSLKGEEAVKWEKLPETQIDFSMVNCYNDFLTTSSARLAYEKTMPKRMSVTIPQMPSALLSQC